MRHQAFLTLPYRHHYRLLDVGMTLEHRFDLA